MKVVYLAATARPGGAERNLLDMLAGLRSARPDWDLHVIFGADGPLVRNVRELGAGSSVLPFAAPLASLGDFWLNGNANTRNRLGMLQMMVRASPSVTAYLFHLRRALRVLAPELVHTNALKMDILAAWTKPAGTRLLWHVHDYVGSRPVMAHLIRAHSGACAAAIANSKSVAEQLRRICGRELAVYPIYNAVDLARFAPTGARLDLDALAHLAPAPPGTIRVGTVGTLARWKGHEVFLRALSMMPKEISLRGYVIGGPVYQTVGSQYSREELRAMAARLGVDGRVGFTGFVDDSAAAMRSLDIVVHASTQPEPFGLVIAEAMACAKPVVVSGAGGACEIVRAGTDALSYPPGDAAALARCIGRFAENENLRASFGKTARAAAEERFDRKRLARELIDVYAAVA
jgi:glycosyltransferase involved in cell wall biosynthesis